MHLIAVMIRVVCTISIVISIFVLPVTVIAGNCQPAEQRDYSGAPDKCSSDSHAQPPESVSSTIRTRGRSPSYGRTFTPLAPSGPMPAGIVLSLPLCPRTIPAERTRFIYLLRAMAWVDVALGAISNARVFPRKKISETAVLPSAFALVVVPSDGGTLFSSMVCAGAVATTLLPFAIFSSTLGPLPSQVRL